MFSRRNRNSNGGSGHRSSDRPAPSRDARRSQLSDADSDADADADANSGTRPSNRSRIFGVSYQDMIGPPTMDTADSLVTVASTRDKQRVIDNSCTAIQGISDAIVAINDALLEQRKAISRQQRRSNQPDREELELWGPDEAADRDSYLQHSRQQADDALQALVEASLALTQQGEELTREMIDVMVDADDFHAAITEAADRVRNEARTRKAAHQTALQEARAARLAAAEADEPAPEGLAQSDDEDDAPGDAPFVTLRNALNAQVQAKVAAYSAQSAYARYATHNEYAAFKRYVHRSIYEDARDLPDKKRWFDKDGLPVLPTREALLGEEDADMADGSDDELVIQRVKYDYKCPLSLRELVDPWKNTKCNHVYEKKSIFGLLAQSHRNTVECPVVACSVVCISIYILASRFVYAL